MPGRTPENPALVLDQLTFRLPSPRAASPSRQAAVWLVLLALSQIADLATTWLGVASGLREGNPVVAATLEAGSFAAFAAVKVGLLAGMAATLALTTRPRDRSLALQAVRVLVLAFTLVALGNLAVTLIG